jgi:hypothetical protein
MIVCLRFTLVALILQVSSSTLVVADNKDWFDNDCNGTTFHLAKSDDREQLVFRLSLGNLPFVPELMAEEWLDVAGQRCSGDGKCEGATHARVWLVKKKGIKRVSGKYEADFGGQHLEGQFVAKYQKHRPMLICE